MSAPVEVVLADDHTVLRVGLRAFLEDQREPVFRVVAEASSGEEAVELVLRHAPRLLVLDLGMPGLGGLGAALELQRRGSGTKVVVLTQHADAATLRRALAAGARGYVVKTARGDELVQALRAVLAGGTWVDPSLAGALFTPDASGPDPAASAEDLERLTPREQQVLRLVAEGYTNKEVAEALGVSVKTVMAHRANLMDKLGIHNHSKLVQFAIRAGLTPL